MSDPHKWDNFRQHLMTHMDLVGGMAALSAAVVMDFDNTWPHIYCFSAIVFAGLWLTALGLVTSQVNRGDFNEAAVMERKKDR